MFAEVVDGSQKTKDTAGSYHPVLRCVAAVIHDEQANSLLALDRMMRQQKVDRLRDYHFLIFEELCATQLLLRVQTANDPLVPFDGTARHSAPR